MKNLHTYTRLILTLLLTAVSVVVMGQEIVVPIKSITATPANEGTVSPHTHSGTAHSLNNLLDKDASTTWIADQNRDIKILSFLQLRHVDGTDNGLRSWIELPYIPNENTEIEVVYEADGATEWKTEYIFGSGGLYEPGLSFGLLRKDDGGWKNLFLYTNGTRHDKVVDVFTGKHTLKYSATSFQLDDEPAEAVDGKNLEGAHNLCFFYNPYADKSGARSFKGKIYSVKIRENGKLRYELVPAAENGSSGLYDRISTNFYSFNAEGVDYVENTYTDAYSNTAKVHVKIPLSPEPQSGYEWSNNLVKNGYLTTDDLSSLVPNAHVQSVEIATIENTRALKITSDTKPEDQQDYWSQLFIKLSEQLLPGDKYYVSFDYKADKAAHVNSQLQKGEGQWYSGCAVSVDFTTSWQRGTWEGTVGQPNSQTAVGIIGLSLNGLAESNVYYITNIVVKKQNVKPDQGKIWSENLASTFTAGSSATITGNSDDMTITYDGTQSNPWDSQFIIGLSEPLLPNGKYYISFSYKASKANDVGSYLLSQTGTYDAGISGAMKTLSFTENWQTCDMEVRTVNAEIPEGTPPMRVGFNMNVKDGITYYLRDIVIKKQMDPQPEATPANEPAADSDKKWSKNLVKNGNFKSGDKTAFAVWPNSGKNPTTWSIVDGHDGGKAVEVISNLTSGNTWDSNFNISLDDIINPGEKYYISFDYKAGENASIVTAYDNNSGDQIAYNPINLPQATTEWQTYTSAALTNDKESAIKKLVLMLNASPSVTRFYFANIVIKKQVPLVDNTDAPAAEISIRFKDLNESMTDLYTSRHLFSLGTYEEKVLALTTNQKMYKYVSGGREKYTGDIRNNTDVFEATFKPGEFTIGGNTYSVDGSPIWNSADALYLMGTHRQPTVDAGNPCSFIGQIYSASLKENGLLIYDLIPAVGDNGEYGFVDKITGKFFGVDGCSGTGADGRLGAGAASGYGGGATEVDFKMPFKIDITTTPQIVRDFAITTALRDAGENDANYNNPDKWLLYASNDGNLWTKLSVAPPSVTTQDIDENEEYYLYNVETSSFLAGANEWKTRASVTGSPSRFKIESNGDGTYKLQNYVDLGWSTPAWKYLFVGDDNDIWIDRNEQVNYDKWVLTKIDDTEGIYEISFQGHDGKVGTAQDNYVSDSRLYIRDGVKNSKWAFVRASDYLKYAAANADDEPNVPLRTNGVKYKFKIKNNSESYTQYRLVVEKVIVNNSGFSRLRLGDLEFTTNYVFEHYHGRVYDESPLDIPENLRVGGTSGYQTVWKTQADDTRLGSGIQIQRTHEYEHVIYVLPGTTVNLTPFSDFDIANVTDDNVYNNAYNYREQYIRWYDYNTDLRSDNLSFDPRNGHEVNEFTSGHFAWNHRNDGRRTREGSVAKYTAELNPVVDANGVIDVIALEAANDFDWSKNGSWVDNAYYLIKEPTLQWRHLFVIKDARIRADEIAVNNAAYIANNKITLMCPSETPFQYPLPCFEYAVGDGTGHPTDFYKKTGEGTYEPIQHYLIETTRGDGAVATTYLDFSSGKAEVVKTNVTGELTKDQVAYSFKEKDGYNRVFYLEHPITNPAGTIGEYWIRIYALESGNTKGVQLMQYDLKVLPNKDGYMVDEETLTSDDYLYPNQRPQMMDKAFGQPTTKIDFDEVKAAETQEVGENHYFKWPWQWENSSYGFGYEDRGDYNMYMVADHMAVTPNKGKAKKDSEDKEIGDDLTGADVYDRKYYDNGKDASKRGYFYYCNAASDPSRMAVLNIGRDFCSGTKVYVSAWINEFQHRDLYAETANVIFSFRGVKADGTETVLNSFVTGYVSGGWNTPYGYDRDGFVTAHEKDSDGKIKNPDKRGKWMHVYYTFTTDQDQDFDHYIITLENNCTSSEGADYAIDDIRCYVRKPQMTARFMKPVCDGSAETEMELFGDFESLSDAFSFDGSSDKSAALYYCFLDRETYEAELQKEYDKSGSRFTSFTDWRQKSLSTDATSDERASFIAAYRNAFNKALIKAYGDSSKKYGTLTLYEKYATNPLYNEESITYNNQGQRQEVGVIKNIIFPCKATDGQIKAGKRYILAVVTSNPSDETTYKLEDKCGSFTDFEVPLPAIIKIDGALQSNLSGMSFCSNQRPVIDIDLNGVKKGGEPVSKDEVDFDWYYGPKDLGEEQLTQGYTRAYQQEEKNGIRLWNAMLQFRLKNPGATQDDVLKENGIVTDAQFTPEMLSYIQETVRQGRLVLLRKTAIATAYLFGENMNPEMQKEFYMTAIPINPNLKDVEFCLDAINVVIKLSQNTPHMKDGAGSVSYPADMVDVPLRIGLKQLKRSVISSLDDDATIERQLWLPLRAISPVTLTVTDLIRKADDYMLYLVDSNDPIALTEESGGISIVIDNNAINGEPGSSSLVDNEKIVGKILDISAVKDRTEDYCKIAFLNSFKFREGYWYTLKFHFKEKYDDDESNHTNVCPGDVVFTIKVVPEYQMWTGAVSRNWNDDRNWKRVTKDELLWTDAKDAAFLTANADYITDGGTNINTGSYAPADFTKVIIPADALRVPFMYNMREGGNKTSVQFVGAPKAGFQIKTTRPGDSVFDEIGGLDSNDQASLDLDGKTFVITDASGTKTLGVTLKEGVRPGGPQDAFVVNNSIYTDDMYVYAKFNRVVKAGVDGNVYTIQLYNANGIYHSAYGGQGYLNFQPTGQVVFALGLSSDQTYGQDGENLALWRVERSGDGVTIQNMGRANSYLNPSAAAPSVTPIVCQLVKSFSTFGAGEVYHLASRMQYDMASIDRADNDVACRPWYDHTCDQIHFNAGAAMMDQRYLYYNKAWCDIDVIPGTWQTVASPLMNIVAGDLYLPTATARQTTPLFEDITYQTTLNDRFKPAVFQRSWNKSNATVYKLGGGSEDVGIKLDWSHVYNDVNVQYGAGQGFSIKVDVSAMPETAQPGKGSNPATARFRFPKADKQYTYYNPNNTDGDKKTEPVNDANIVAGVRPGRLADLTSNFSQQVGDNGNGATSTAYFLVGNPLMCWLDMQQFFAQNTQFEPKYWIATADGQRTALFTEDGFLTTSNENPKFLPPGVSFFVHLKQNQDGQAGASSTVTPVFNNTMMSYTQAEPRQNNADGSPITRASQSAIPQLMLMATDKAGRQTKAVLTDGAYARHSGVETLFDSNLKDDVLIYTTKGGQAMTIADVAAGDTLPLIISGTQDELHLSLRGAEDFETPLYLYDSETGETLPLMGDIELTQNQNGVKYYILADPTSVDDEADTAMPRVVSNGNVLTVTLAGEGNIERIRICRVDGINVTQEVNVGSQFSIILPRNVYIIDMDVDGKHYTVKMAVG